MATYSRPGVFIQEVELPQTVVLADNGSAIGAFVGALAKGPVNAPVLLNSWTDFTKTFGNIQDAYPTTWAAYNFFANGGRQLYVKRSLGTGSELSSVLITDRSIAGVNTLRVRASNPGSWGNSLAVEVKSAGTSARFSFIVYGEPTVSNVSNSNVLEQFTDLSMDPTDPRYVVSVINSASTFVRVEDQFSTSPGNDAMPKIDGLKALTGGQDGAEPVLATYEADLLTFDPIQNPLVFNIPAVAYLYSTGDSNTARDLTIDINAALISYCESRGDAFAIIDPPGGQTVAEAQDYLADVKAAALILDSDSGCAASYYPWLAIPDSLRATPGALRLQAPGAAMVGQYLATDASRGVFKTPAGYSNRVALAVSTEKQLTNTELDTLNSGETPLNAIRQIPGTGIVVMGGRTLHNSPGDRYINIRRSLIYIKKELSDRSAFAVFENNDERLWSQIRVALGSFLRSYWQQGGLRGTSPDQAFYVKVDKSTTTDSDISSGKVNVEIGVALEYPAEFIVIKLGQITGNATV